MGYDRYFIGVSSVLCRGFYLCKTDAKNVRFLRFQFFVNTFNVGRQFFSSETGFC